MRGFFMENAMPRTNGVYSLPSGSRAIPDTTVRSAPYNSVLDDLAADANSARPITAGGTGATNATKARENLGALAVVDIVDATTKSSPIDGDGVVITDSADTGKLKRVLWSRLKASLKTYFDGVFLGLGGGSVSGAITVDSVGARILMKGANSYPDVSVEYSNAGNVGFYDRTAGKWMLRVSATGILADVNVPTSLLTGTMPSARFENMTYGGNAGAWLQLNGRQDGDQTKGMSIRISTSQDFYLTSDGTNVFQVWSDGKVRISGSTTLGGTLTWSNGDGQLHPTGYLQGSYWEGFGNSNARQCIWDRIEARGAAYRDAAINSAVAQSMPMPSTATSTATVNFPVGHYVAFDGVADRNAAVTLYKGNASGTPTGAHNSYSTRDVGAENRLTGTWRARGVGLAQRIA